MHGIENENAQALKAGVDLIHKAMTTPGLLTLEEATQINVVMACLIGILFKHPDPYAVLRDIIAEHDQS